MIPSILDYLPEQAEQLMKLATEQKKDSPATARLKIMGKGLLGFGGGLVAGVGAGALADKLYERATGTPIPRSTLLRAAPLVTGALGMAYGIHKSLEQEELNRVREA